MESQRRQESGRRKHSSKDGELTQDTTSMTSHNAGIGQSPMLFLPEGYSEDQLATMLNYAVKSPVIMRSNAMVNVINSPPPKSTDSITETDDEDDIFREFLVDDPESLDVVDKTLRPPMEKSTEIASSKIISAEIIPIEVSSDEIALVSNIPDEQSSDEMETMVGADNPLDIAEFEKAQENQFLSIMSAITPLKQTIGGDPGELCTVCFHVGHYQSDFFICPVARLKSFLSGNSFYDSLPDLAPAMSTIKQDLGLTCQALAWAIQYKDQGSLEQIGIFNTAMIDLQAVLRAWNSILSKETFAFGRFGELGVDILSAEPVDIPMIETKGGLYQQKFGRPHDASKGFQGQILTESAFPQKAAALRPSAIDMKSFGPPPADRLKLEVLGARPNTICATCLHRGHAQNSTKLCPFKIIVLAIDRMQSRGRKKRIENVTKEVERLQKLVDDLGPGVKGVKNIIDLLDEWHEAIEKTVDEKKSKVVAKASHVPTGFVDHEMADAFTSIFRDEDHNNPHKSLDCPSDLPPEMVDGSTYTRSIQQPYKGSTALNSPFKSGVEPLSFAFPESNSSPAFPEDLNQLYGTFDDLDGIPDFCDQDFCAPSPPKSLTTAMGGLSAFQQESQQTKSTPKIYRSRSSSQTLPDPTPAGTKEWRENSQNDELPPEIFWRQKCTLKVIGVRKDNLCKCCLHYGHDRSSFSCPAQLVFQSMLMQGRNPLSAKSSVEDLRSAIAWQKTIPEAYRGDVEGIQSLVDRWETAVKIFQSKMSEIEVDSPARKRRRRSPNTLDNQPPNLQYCEEQVPGSPSLVKLGNENQKTAPPAVMQMNYRNRHVTATTPMKMDYATQFLEDTYTSPHYPSQKVRPLPLQVHPQGSYPGLQVFPAQETSHQDTTQNQITNQQKAGFKNTLSQQQQHQHFSQQSPPVPERATAPGGVFYDYHRIPGHLLPLVMDYVIDESEQGNENRILVDYHRMPKGLFLSLRGYVSKVPEPAAAAQQSPRCDKRKRT